MKKRTKAGIIFLLINCLTRCSAPFKSINGTHPTQIELKEKNLPKQVKNLALAGTISIGCGILEGTFSSAANAIMGNDGTSEAKKFCSAFVSYATTTYMQEKRRTFIKENIGNSSSLSETGDLLALASSLATQSIIRTINTALTIMRARGI